MNARAETIGPAGGFPIRNVEGDAGAGPQRFPVSQLRHHFATLLSSSVPSIQRDGKELYEVPIAVTGQWVKNGCEFSITTHDLAAMVRNFEKRKNEQVVIDYEHASETPQVALGGPVPAAGWIHELRVRNSGFGVRSSELGVGSFGSEPKNSERRNWLTALVEWTKEALDLIRSGAYRFFSPAIDWNYRDKASGEPQGVTLTSGALTNHPFLEELPPLMLCDYDLTSLVGERAPRQRRESGEGLTEEAQGEKEMKKLSLKKLDAGPAAGHHGVFDDLDPVGFVDAGEFADYARQQADASGEAVSNRGAGEASEGSGDCPSPQLAERIGVTPSTTFDELRRRLATDGSQAEARAVLLGEALQQGALDNARAAVLAREGRITLADYIAAQEAEKKLEEAVRAGKILPRDRKFFFRDALERPREFDEYLAHLVPALRLGSVGLGSAGELSVDDEVRVRTERLIAEEHLSYSKALKKVLASDRELERRYRAAHRRRLLGDIDNEGAASGITP